MTPEIDFQPWRTMLRVDAVNYDPYELERIEARGLRPVNLASGVNFLVPDHALVERALPAIVDPLQHLDYDGPLGDAAARSAVGTWFAACGDGADITLENVALVVGAAHGLFLAGRYLAATGHTVGVVPAPTFPLAAAALRANGMTIREIGAGPGPRLLPSAADTAEAVSPRSIVYVNIFNNPTGECLDADELERLVGVAAENDSVVLVDIVSASLLHDDERACDNLRLLARAVGARRPVLVVGGLAKERGLPGIRGGWLIGPRDDIREIAPLNELIAPSSPTMTAPVVAVDALVRGVEWRVRREAEPGKALAEVAESVAAEVVARLPPHARASPVGALLARLAATPDAVRELAAGVIAWHRRVSATLDSNWAELQRDHADTLQSGGTWLGDFNAFVRVPLLDGLDAVDTTHRLFRERGVQILPGPVFGTDVRLWGPPDAFWTRLSFALPPEDWRRGLGLFLDWADSAARRASARRACG